MIRKLITDMAGEKGITLKSVEVIDGAGLGINDAFLVNLWHKDFMTSVVIMRNEMEKIRISQPTDSVIVKLMRTFARLENMIKREER